MRQQNLNKRLDVFGVKAILETWSYPIPQTLNWLLNLKMIQIRSYLVWPGSIANNEKGTSTLQQVLNENGQAMPELDRVPIWLGKSNNSKWVGGPSYAPAHHVASWPDLFQTMPDKKAFLKLAKLVEDVRLDAEALKYYWFHKYHRYYSCQGEYIDCRWN